MARLPSERYLIQQINGTVILFESGTDEEIVRFDPSDANATAIAQRTIYESDRLSDEDKCFAHFWSGYFHAYAQFTHYSPSLIGDKSTETEHQGQVNVKD